MRTHLMTSVRPRWPVLALLTILFAGSMCAQTAAAPGSRVMMDAHNCYPYGEWWSDRIDRALSAGPPLAIEQDLAWYTNPRTGASRSVLSHDSHPDGHEPGMREYFFERVRPIVEKALHDGDRSQWPLITLNLDFKTEEPEHLRAVWQLLEEYKDWITTATRTANLADVQPLDVKPILILTGQSDAQQAVFYDAVPAGAKLLVFGSVHAHTDDPMAPPEVLDPKPADNYRRWWNNSWSVVERGGAQHGGEWTAAKSARVQELVRHAHREHLWIRFYTLDGINPAELSCHGWFRSYDFGSLGAAQARWLSAMRAGADYIASDQYEDLAAYLRQHRNETAPEGGKE